MRFVKTFGLAGAASIISMNAAYAGQLASPPAEDLFDTMLELDEAPMSAAALSEARGGFSIGGLQFNIGVQLPPVVIAPVFADGGPLPNGPFGDAGGPLPNGPFGDAGGPLPNGVFGSADNSNASNNAPPTQSNAPQASAGAEALAASAQAAANQAAQAAAQQQTPVTQSSANVQPQQSTQQQSSASTPSAVQSQPALLTQPTQQQPASAPTATASNNTITQQPALQTQSSPSTPQTNVASQNNVSGAPGGNIPQQNEVPDAMPVQNVSVASASDESNSPPAEATMSMVLSEVKEPEVSQQSGPNGITTIFNNVQNNVHLTARVNMNVEVQNYGFVMGMTRAVNLTTQAVTQSFFLRGLN